MPTHDMAGLILNPMHKWEMRDANDQAQVHERERSESSLDDDKRNNI
jgi:hypothetical protein